jgi:hypothetical protein
MADEFVGMRLYGFDAVGFGVVKLHGLVAQDGLLQQTKVGGSCADIFELVAVDGDGVLKAAVKEIAEELRIKRRKQPLQSGQTGEALDVGKVLMPTEN